MKIARLYASWTEGTSAVSWGHPFALPLKPSGEPPIRLQTDRSTMGPRRSSPRLLSSFGWSLSGALLLALSLPPLGFYPLAWIGMVPLLVRWSVRAPSVAYARELYALLLTTSCCVGFWLLFHPDAATAALGGLSLFLVPLPLTAAFVLANLVRARYGLRLGLVALGLNVIALEFLLLRVPFSIPWLLLGHTQVGAVEFIQMADLGGVLLLSAWVLFLNVAAFLALPQSEVPGERYGERGLSIAVFTAFVALPVVYGAVRTAQADVPAGYTRIAIVQPGVASSLWDTQDPAGKVDYLTSLSGRALDSWQRIGAGDRTDRIRPVETTGDLGLIVWPQSSLPFMGTDAGERQLYDRVRAWSDRNNVSVLAGAKTAPPAVDRAARPPSADELANSAVLIRPGSTVTRYDQMRSVPFADPQGTAGTDRVLFESGSTQIAAAIGFESLFGDHVRQFPRAGANLIVVVARNDLWGRSAGLYQHLQITRLRAIETRRAVVLSTMSGVSALIHPSGAIDEIAGWMEQEVQPLDVPTYHGETVYVRHGDWLGRWALLFGLVLNGTLAVIHQFFPGVLSQPLGRRRMAYG